jgi:predicted nucleic acid-binding protein
MFPSDTILFLEKLSAVSILVDTGAWYAVADSSDRHHEIARRFYAEHAGRTPLVTTDLILAESWTLLSSHLGRQAAFTFWEALRETRTPILTAEQTDLEAAWHILQAYPDQSFSLVDCTTFAIMERFAITEVFPSTPTSSSTVTVPIINGRSTASPLRLEPNRLSPAFAAFASLREEGSGSHAKAPRSQRRTYPYQGLGITSRSPRKA